MLFSFSHSVRSLSIVAMLLVLAAACSHAPAGTPEPTTDPQPTATTQPSPTPPDPATTQPSPTPPDPASTTEIFVAVTSPLETVYDWSKDRCAPDDIPDMPSRAFLNSEGNVLMNRSRPQNRLLIGSDLDSLQANCDLALDSSNDPNPSQFNSHEWFQAFYTEDGWTIHAVLHNEHCDGPGATCSYQNMTYAMSNDGGLTFEQPVPPGHVVAASPFPFDPENGFHGMVAGSSIVRAEDGYYYMAALQISPGGEDRWVCMLRTQTLDDPASWRAWDGEAFDHEFIHPYTGEIANPGEALCTPVALEYNKLASMNDSLTYSSYLERYILLGTMDKHINGRQVWGIYYSVSPDLVEWSERRLLHEISLSAHSGPGGPDAIAYPTLLDPDSPSNSFDRVDQEAFVYFTRFNFQQPGGMPDADLVRFPVSFQVDRDEAERLDVRTSIDLTLEQTDKGPELRGTLTNRAGEPIANTAVTISRMPQAEGRLVEYRLAETAPEGARSAVAGLRMNTECNCFGPGEVALLELSYREQGGEERVPNGDFQSGLAGYANTSSGVVELVADIGGQGPGLRLAVDGGSHVALHSANFAVDGGADFEFVVRAVVEPGSQRSGYFALIFLGPAGELGRMKIPLLPYREAVATVNTNEQGEFRLLLEEPLETATLRASFEGSADHWPSSAEVEVP